MVVYSQRRQNIDSKATQKGVSHREFSHWKWNQKFINLSFLQTVNSLRYHAMHIKFHNIQYSFEIHTQVVHGDDGGKMALMTCKVYIGQGYF